MVKSIYVVGSEEKQSKKYVINTKSGEYPISGCIFKKVSNIPITKPFYY